MMHVVHVIDPEHAGDQALLACAACLEAKLCSQSVILIGTAKCEHDAWALGVRTGDRVSSRSRLIGPTARALSRALREHQRPHEDPIVVNCWSVSTAKLCAQARLRAHWPSIVLSTDAPSHLALSSLPDRFVRAGVSTDATRSVEGHAGASPHFRFAHARDTVVTPIRALGPCLPRVDRLTAQQRTRARAELNIAPSDRVVMLLADPPARGDLHRFSMVLALLQAAGAPCVGIARVGGLSPERAERFAHGLGNRWALLQLVGSIVDLLNIADVAVVDHPPFGVASCGSVGVQLAATMGVPVVMSATDDPSGNLGEGGRWLAASGQEAMHLMPMVLALVEDPLLRARVAEQVRSHVMMQEGEESFAERLFQLWREVANVPGEVVGSARA